MTPGIDFLRDTLGSLGLHFRRNLALTRRTCWGGPESAPVLPLVISLSRPDSSTAGYGENPLLGASSTDTQRYAL